MLTERGVHAASTTRNTNHVECLAGRTPAAPKRQLQPIFRLLLARSGAMIGKTTNGRHLKPATAARVTVEAWLRCQGLITVRQNQKPNGQPLIPNVGLTINSVAQWRSRYV